MGSGFVRAKLRAIATLRRNRLQVRRAFTTQMRHEVHFDLADAEHRIRRATFMDDPDFYGTTDGEHIWISVHCPGQDLVSVLCHEGLHDSVYLQRPTRSGEFKLIGIDDEHAVMQRLPFCY